MAAVKKALFLYKDNFNYILLIGMTIVFPILLGYTFVVNYAIMPFEFFGIPLWPQLLHSFFMLIALFMLHPPFVSMVVQDHRFGEVKLGGLYTDTLQYMFPIYILGILYAFTVTLGMVFFIIPGVALLLMFLAVPQTALIDDLVWWQGIKQSCKFGLKRFFPLLGIFLMFAVIDTLLSSLILFVAMLITKYFIFSNLVIMIVNALSLPFFIFTVGYMYWEWKEERSENESGFRIRHE